MDSARDDIYRWFRDHPGKEITAPQLATRFRVTRGYVTNCIRYRPRNLDIQKRTEDGQTYYWRPKAEKPREEL